MVSIYFLKKVVNNKKGQHFIKKVKEFYKKKNCRVSLKGRHSDRINLFRRLGLRSTWTMDVPVKHAEEISIYVYPKTGISFPEFRYGISWKEHYEVKE